MYPNSGAAPAAMRAFMASLGANVTTCDGSSPLLEQAQALAGSERSSRWVQPVMPPDRAAVVRIGQEPFDAVYTCGMLQHLTHQELCETAGYIRQSVTKNAVVIAVVPLERRADPDRFVQTFFKAEKLPTAPRSLNAGDFKKSLNGSPRPDPRATNAPGQRWFMFARTPRIPECN